MATGVIDAHASRKKALQPRILAGWFMIFAIALGYYYVMHKLHITTAAAHPGVILLLPPVTVAAIALILPLCFFVTYDADFGNLNPLNPVHFVKIAVKTYTALNNNNWKVSEKDL